MADVTDYSARLVKRGSITSEPQASPSHSTYVGPLVMATGIVNGRDAQAVIPFSPEILDELGETATLRLAEPIGRQALAEVA